MIKEVVEKLEKIAEKEIENRKSILSQINILYDDIINENFELNFIRIEKSNDIKDHIACGVDGGKYEVELDDVTFVIAKTAMIEGRYVSKKPIPKNVKEDFKILSNHYGKSNIMNSSTLLMLYLETSMMEKCEYCDIIFIDGPIIEPPYYDENNFKVEDFPSFNELVKYRANIINKLKNKRIIGIVKNFYHRFIINYLISEGYRKLLNARESYLIYNLFIKYRRENKWEGPLALGIINWDDISEREKVEDLKFLMKTYSLYKEECGGIVINSLYYQLDQISPIVRVDLLSSDNVAEALNYTSLWGISGVKEVTVLNKLADEYSSITQKDVISYIKLFKIFYYKNFNEEFIAELTKKY